MIAYYNENDPKAAAWLRELIREGLIADGIVDERSIEDVEPDELMGFSQCNFFAGIGGWSYALRLAGWPDDRPVWTGSCPCQPFSAAGSRKGAADDRHLWPVFWWLIAQRRPATVFGEQVASRLGREWLGRVRADLEALEYRVGAADLCAAGIGAPHIRQRIFWVADNETGRRGGSGGMGDANGRRCEIGGLAEHRAEKRERGLLADRSGARRPWDGSIWIPCGDGKARRIEPGIEPLAHGFSANLANVLSCCIETWQQVACYAERTKTDPDEILRLVWRSVHPKENREGQPVGVRVELHAQEVLLSLLLSAAAARDGAADICSSKKKGAIFIDRAMRGMRGDYRNVRASHRWKSEEQPSREPADVVHELSLILARHVETFRKETELAHASLVRVTLLRGYGNAIVPQVAAEFIKASIG